MIKLKLSELFSINTFVSLGKKVKGKFTGNFQDLN